MATDTTARSVPKADRFFRLTERGPLSARNCSPV